MKGSTKDIIELTGIAGIIASLIFVGLQLSQDRKVALAEQYNYRSDLAIQLALGQLENDSVVEEISRAWNLGYEPGWATPAVKSFIEDTDMSIENAVRISLIATIEAIAFDNLYYSYEQGLLDGQRWEAILSATRGSVRRPIYYAVHQGQAATSPEARKLLE